MNSIPQPIHNDQNTLNDLGQSNYRNYLNELNFVLQAYRAYINANGSGLALNPLNHLNVNFTNSFRGLYTSKRQCMAYVKALRKSELLCCPMCGSLGVGSLDHLLPKDIFAEFAIFSRNLVPCCCDCNNKKGITYSNIQTNARVLHPYFDAFLSQRLIYTEINANNGDFQRPLLSVVEVNPNHQNAVHIRFHMNEIVLKTDILNRQIGYWKKIHDRPSIYFNNTPRTINDLNTDLNSLIARYDNEHDSRNNWKSMLFHGLSQSAGAKNYLINSWQQRGL